MCCLNCPGSTVPAHYDLPAGCRVIARISTALAGVAQLAGATECHPIQQKVAVRFPIRAHTQVSGSIPGWAAYGKQPVDGSLSLPLSNISFLKKGSMSICAPNIVCQLYR